MYRCEICGKGPQVGHNVSHANNKTKRRWMPNLQKLNVIANGQACKARVCSRCIRNGYVTKNVRIPKVA